MENIPAMNYLLKAIDKIFSRFLAEECFTVAIDSDSENKLVKKNQFYIR